MTGEKSNFLSLAATQGGSVAFGNEKSDIIVDIGKIGESLIPLMVSKEFFCVEESVHVLFDESNSLVENDAQDEDVELGLAKKDLLLTHEER